MDRDRSHSPEPTESSPLLPPSYEDDQTQQQNRKPWQNTERLTLLVMLAVLLFSLGDQWMDPPQIRIFEAIICYRYYEKVDPSKILVGREAVGPGAIGGVAEMWCKVDAVQSDLAALRGWQQLFDGLPSLLLAVPLGWVADRYGRKPIVLVGVVSLVLRASWIQMVTWFWQAFDVRWSWLSTLFASMGGGSAVLTSLIFVLLSDITPEAKRAAVFLRVGAFNILAALIMPPLAAVLMEVSPWIPNLGGTVLEMLTLILCCFCPETLNYQNSSSVQDHDLAPPAEPVSNSTDFGASRASAIMKAIRRWITKFIHSLSFITNDWRVVVLIAPFLNHMLVGAMGSLLLQYVSRRYEIKLSKAILLVTIRMGVIVLLLFSILPYVSNAVIRRFQLSAQRKDLYLARISFILVAAGWMLVGLSPNLVLVAISLTLTALGNGAWLMVRSFVSSLVPQHHIARVYSVITIVDTLGAMLGSPLMAGLFKRGLALGGIWTGLPFYFLGLASAFFSLLLFLIGLRKGEDERPSLEEDE